ncbi:MAG: DUF2911 domain-containing protein [Bacteroidota bacterium]
MKNLLLLTSLLLTMTLKSVSQDVGGKTLVSQSRTTKANIGKCDITINYHSPSVNGRKIFGGIVPYDFVVDGVEYPWRAGSNQRTTIEFSHDVIIEGQKLAAGSYGFLILVSKDEWTLIFSSGKTWGAFNYDKANDILRVPIKTTKAPFQEWLSYEYLNPQSESVDIQLRWEKTAVSFRVETNALDNILTDLESKEDKTAANYQEMAIRTLEKDPTNFAEVMNFLELSKEKIADYEKESSQKAYTFNYNILKGELLIDMGKEKEGNKLIKEALDQAQGFNIYYYALNKLTVKNDKEGAYKLLSDAVERDPSNHANHLAFGEYYLKDGNQAKATEHFKKAYEITSKKGGRSQNYARCMYLQNKMMLGGR